MAFCPWKCIRPVLNTMESEYNEWDRPDKKKKKKLEVGGTVDYADRKNQSKI